MLASPAGDSEARFSPRSSAPSAPLSRLIWTSFVMATSSVIDIRVLHPSSELRFRFFFVEFLLGQFADQRLRQLGPNGHGSNHLVLANAISQKCLELLERELRRAR